jgi:hypothetical protein
MVDKLETAAKPADCAGSEKGDQGDKNHSLNLVALTSDQSTKAPDTTAGNQADSAMKGFPSVEMFDSGKPDSPKEQNRKSSDAKEKPQQEGTGNWAALENFTLATDKPDSPKKAENRASFDAKEKPQQEGTGNWAALENFTLATGKADSPKKAENRASFDAKEKPQHEGTGNW